MANRHDSFAHAVATRFLPAPAVFLSYTNSGQYVAKLLRLFDEHGSKLYLDMAKCLVLSTFSGMHYSDLSAFNKLIGSKLIGKMMAAARKHHPPMTKRFTGEDMIEYANTAGMEKLRGILIRMYSSNTEHKLYWDNVAKKVESEARKQFSIHNRVMAMYLPDIVRKRPATGYKITQAEEKYVLKFMQRKFKIQIRSLAECTRSLVSRCIVGALRHTIVSTETTDIDEDTYEEDVPEDVLHKILLCVSHGLPKPTKLTPHDPHPGKPFGTPVHPVTTNIMTLLDDESKHDLLHPAPTVEQEKERAKLEAVLLPLLPTEQQQVVRHRTKRRKEKTRKRAASLERKRVAAEKKKPKKTTTVTALSKLLHIPNLKIVNSVLIKINQETDAFNRFITPFPTQTITYGPDVIRTRGARALQAERTRLEHILSNRYDFMPKYTPPPGKNPEHPTVYEHPVMLLRILMHRISKTGKENEKNDENARKQAGRFKIKLILLVHLLVQWCKKQMATGSTAEHVVNDFKKNTQIENEAAPEKPINMLKKYMSKAIPVPAFLLEGITSLPLHTVPDKCMDPETNKPLRLFTNYIEYYWSAYAVRDFANTLSTKEHEITLQDIVEFFYGDEVPPVPSYASSTGKRSSRKRKGRPAKPTEKGTRAQKRASKKNKNNNKEKEKERTNRMLTLITLLYYIRAQITVVFAMAVDKHTTRTIKEICFQNVSATSKVSFDTINNTGTLYEKGIMDTLSTMNDTEKNAIACVAKHSKHIFSKINPVDIEYDIHQYGYTINPYDKYATALISESDIKNINKFANQPEDVVSKFISLVFKYIPDEATATNHQLLYDGFFNDRWDVDDRSMETDDYATIIANIIPWGSEDADRDEYTHKFIKPFVKRILPMLHKMFSPPNLAHMDVKHRSHRMRSYQQLEHVGVLMLMYRYVFRPLTHHFHG